MWVQLTLGPFPEPVTAQLVDLIARRAPAVAAHPGGPRRFSYRSPVFDVEYLNACQLSAALFGIDPSPSVEEGIAPGIGRIEFTTVGRVTANYVSHRCARQTTAQFREAAP